MSVATTARRRVCFVLPSLAGGGAERAAVHILNGLDPAAWDRRMYLFAREGPYLADVDAGVQVDSGDAAGRGSRWRALRRYLQASRPDLVVSFLSYFTVLTAARAARVGARVAFNQQTPMSAFLDDADYPWRRRWHRRVFERVTRAGYGAADLVVTTSQGVADDLAARFGVSTGKMRVVHNPVDLEAVRRHAREALDPGHEAQWQAPVLVAAGRLADAKNYPLMIEALAQLRARVPARLFVLGQGEREAALRALVDAHGLADAVTFCGFQRNPWRYIARADAFVLTSRYEGFGNVLVEAMACGVPVVATASAGTRDIVADGETGVLVERHEPAAVADAIARVVSDPAARARMGEAARAASARFALPAVAREYDRVFREVLA